MEQTRLGDDVYASFDGQAVWLTTSKGDIITNEVVLDEAALKALAAFLQSLHLWPRAG